jgi:hypothetical protein
MNKFLCFAIIFLLLLGIVGQFTSLSPELTMYADGLVTVAEDLGIIMMLINGTFISTRLFKVSLLFIGLAILGFIFKVMHLPGADQLLLYPFIGVWLVYFIHFLLKQDKKALDVLKVLMLLSFMALPPLIMLHIASEESREIFVLINRALFWLTFLYFLYNGYKGKLLFRQ